METPAILRQGNRPPPPDFFQTSPKESKVKTKTYTDTAAKTKKAARVTTSKAKAAAAAADRDRDRDLDRDRDRDRRGSSPTHQSRRRPSDSNRHNGINNDSGDRDRDRDRDRNRNRDRDREYIRVGKRELEGDDGTEEEDSAAEVRSGRLDTLGWVSASWEPRRVVLRTDGSMSVGPLGMMEGSEGQKHSSRSQQRQQRGSGGDGEYTESSAAQTTARAAKMLGGGTPNWNVPASPPNWSSMLKSKTQARANGSSGKNSNGGVDGGGDGVNGGDNSANATGRTEGMTIWASNTSNASSTGLRSTSSRLASGLMAVAAAASGGGGNGGGGREQQVPGSPASSSATNTSGSGEKVNTFFGVCVLSMQYTSWLGWYSSTRLGWVESPPPSPVPCARCQLPWRA